jgi:hypothetical protein
LYNIVGTVLLFSLLTWGKQTTVTARVLQLLRLRRSLTRAHHGEELKSVASQHGDDLREPRERKLQTAELHATSITSSTCQHQNIRVARWQNSVQHLHDKNCRISLEMREPQFFQTKRQNFTGELYSSLPELHGKQR